MRQPHCEAGLPHAPVGLDLTNKFNTKNLKFSYFSNYHGGVSGSALACLACKSSQRPGFEFRVKRSSQFKKSQPAVSTTESYFTLSVVCLIVEYTGRQRKGNSKQKNIQIVVGRLGWKWIKRSVLQLLLLNQKDVEQLLYNSYKLKDNIV